MSTGSGRHLALPIMLLASTLLMAACAPSVVWQGRSPDHRHTVEVHADKDGQWVELDGVRQGRYSGIADGSVVFSPDGRHLAFPALRDSTWVVVRDGREGPGWDGIGQLLFSGDGRHLAYAAELDGRWYVVRDSTFGSPVDSLVSGSLAISTTGAHLAFAAWSEGELRVILDDEPGDPLRGVGTLFFDPAGNLFHVGHDRLGMILARNQLTLCNHTAVAWPTVNDDGDRLAYAASDGGPWFVVVDGRPDPPYPDVHSLVFEPGDGRFAYVAGDEHEEIVIVDGRAGRSWSKVGAPVFNTEGGHLGYIARQDTLAVVVVDGTARGVHSQADNLVLNGRGDRFAYLGTDGDVMAVYHDLGADPFHLLIGGSLVFSDDGDHWGCLAGEPAKRRLFLAVDGIDTEVPFDWAHFSATVTANLDEIIAGTAGESLLGDWVHAEMELWLGR